MTTPAEIDWPRALVLTVALLVLWRVYRLAVLELGLNGLVTTGVASSVVVVATWLFNPVSPREAIDALLGRDPGGSEGA